MVRPKLSRKGTLRAAVVYFEREYPPKYDAHKDGLATDFDMREAVNELLRHGRVLANFAKERIHDLEESKRV